MSLLVADRRVVVVVDSRLDAEVKEVLMVRSKDSRCDDGSEWDAGGVDTVLDWGNRHDARRSNLPVKDSSGVLITSKVSLRTLVAAARSRYSRRSSKERICREEGSAPSSETAEAKRKLARSYRRSKSAEERAREHE